MSWVSLAEFPIEKNLKDLNDLLLQHRIVHRFIEENGKQHLWIAEPNRALEVQELVASFLHHQETSINSGDIQSDNNLTNQSRGYQTYQAPIKNSSAVLNPLQGLPITAATIALSVMGFFVVYFQLETAWIVLNFTTFEFIFANAIKNNPITA